MSIPMKDIKERVARVEERVVNIDGEVRGLREARHIHANEIQKHTGLLEMHGESFEDIKELVKEWSINTRANTDALLGFRTMAMTCITMGGGFIGFCGFVGGKLLQWW